MKKILIMSVIFTMVHMLQADTLTEYNAGVKAKCEKNDGEACLLYGMIKLGNHDSINANIYFKKSCELKYGGGCHKHGMMLDIMKERKAALAAFKKGCFLSALSSCWEYDKLTDNKENIEKQFYKKVCDEGKQWGCKKYKNL